MPRSLLWRAFLLIAVVIVLAIGAWVQIFRAFDVEPRTRQIAQMVVSVVNLTRTALITAKPELRKELLLDLAEQEGIRVYPAEPHDRLQVPPEDRPMLQLLAAEIRRDLGAQTRIALERNGERAFWVSFFIEGDEYWIMLPRERVERQLALQWLGWGALVLALALIAAYFIVFRLRRPLAALTHAAREIGRGHAPPALEESGPDEIRTVSRAFNQMARDLARHDEDRALILAGVSHDLRTPLARLRLGIELSGADESTIQAMAADIDHMDRIIGQFLDFARTDSGEAPAITDLAALLQDVARHYRDTGHALTTEIATIGSCLVRPLAMRRLVSNLLDNAFRYGETDVRLRLLTAGREVHIEVLDRGPGIPAADADRMKQPFTRLESARSGKGGSGLGLAIVERIARMHGGRFELLAREGGGLVARIVLPQS
jgi:two-component system osmolarity sensor histidine kinase EnvZ